MIRLAIIALIIYVIWRIFSRVQAKFRHVAGPAEAKASGEMIPCAGCGTFVLKNEAVTTGDKSYCGENCFKKH